MRSYIGVVHGTHDGYANHGCRCSDCTHAFADHMRGAFARRAEKAPCAIAGCDGGLFTLGLCQAHYERQRTGRPVDVQIRRRPGAQGPQPGKRRIT